MIVFAANRAQTSVYYVCPTFRQAKNVCWKMLKGMCFDAGIVSKTNETELSIELINSSVITLKGSDNPDALRGVGLDFLVMDEFADINSDAWFEVLRPALADTQGKALFIGSPKGFNWAYDLYQAAYTLPDWQAWQFTTEQGGNVPLEEIVAAKSSMDERTYRQEFLASFEALTGRVYDKFERSRHCRADLVDTGGDLLVGMDFNILPMSAVIAVRVVDECHVLDCIELPVSNTDEMAIEIRRRYSNRRIICCPDPAGNQRHSNAPVGQTDFTILKRHGFIVKADRTHPPVIDRINNVQAMLMDATGRPRLFIYPRARALIRTLEGHCYKEGTSLPQKGGNPDLSHMGDALGYLLFQEFNRLRSLAIRGSGLQLY